MVRARGVLWAACALVAAAVVACLGIMLYHFRAHYGGLVWPGRPYVLDGVRHTFPKLKRGTPLRRINHTIRQGL